MALWRASYNIGSRESYNTGSRESLECVGRRSMIAMMRNHIFSKGECSRCTHGIRDVHTESHIVCCDFRKGNYLRQFGIVFSQDNHFELFIIRGLNQLQQLLC